MAADIFTWSTPVRPSTASPACGPAVIVQDASLPEKPFRANLHGASTAPELHRWNNLAHSSTLIAHKPFRADTSFVMKMKLPPVSDSGPLLIELRFVNPKDRDDAIQEAWLAHLEGRDPARAVATFAQRLRRNRQRTLVSSAVVELM